MPRCAAEAVRWKGRRGFRLSNGTIEFTVLTGGGHIVDLRLTGSPVNAIWEAPWPTIEPQTFSPDLHASLYGDRPVGKMLSGYSGHALALAYFGMPSPAEAALGLALHGEAASSEWQATAARSDEESAMLVLEVELPVYRLHFRREMTLRARASAVDIKERVLNRSEESVEFQWVEHAAFGVPLFTPDEASLFVSAHRGVTWPLGYEGHELLPNNLEFHWPRVRSIEGSEIDLRSPFTRNGTGFVASLLVDPRRDKGFVAIHNRRLALVAGYVFDRARFPWIALWEENCARGYAPWGGITKVRGVEFGTSPMPLGLDHARKNPSLFETPTLIGIAPQSQIATEYQLFVSPVPADWRAIEDVEQSAGTLKILGDDGQVVSVSY